MNRWSLFSTISKNVTLSWEDRVRKMESRQQEAFSEALANQLQQTLHEETRQSGPERIRNAEFEASMVTLHETFLKNEKSRKQAFRDAELEQEKLAKQSEDSRDIRFKLANDKRDTLFQRDCEARQKRSELYTDIRDRHIRQRHDSREAAFHKLETMLQEQIDTTWRILELVSSAQTDEEGRETIRNMKRYSPIVNGKQKSSTTKAIQSNMSESRSRVRLQSRGRQGTPSYVPIFVIRESRSPGAPPSSGASYVSPSSQQGSVDYTSRRWLNPLLQEVSPHQENGQLPPIEPDSPAVSVMDLPITLPDTQLANDCLCVRNSERRAVQDVRFWEQEEQVEIRFQHAEMQRDTAEATRFRTHDAEERGRDHIFQRTMEANEDRFSQQESTRDRDGTLREQQFDDDQKYRSQLFKQTLRWERQKHVAAQISEEGWIKSARARVEALANVHKQLIEEVRRHQVTAEPSETSQQSRPFDWNCVTAQALTNGLDHAPTEAISRWEIASSNASRHTSKKGHATNRDRRYCASSARRPTPEGFKNRRTRNQGALPLLVPMPGPRFVEHMPIRHLGEKPVVSLHKPPRSFKKAQVERQKVFTCNTKKRRAVFDSKEPERVRQFFEGQKARTYRSRQAEDDRQSLFNQSQLHRNEQFQEGQEKREAGFRQAERHWQQEFLTEQTIRDKLFDTCLERLHQESFTLENRRSLDFDLWCREKLRCVMLRSRSWAVKNNVQA